MDKLNRNFVKGNVLKAEELNELVGKINELVGSNLHIGTTEGTAYDGAAGSTLEQIVRELAGGAGTMYSVYVRNNMESLGFASQYGEKCILDFTFVSQYRDDISEPYKPTGELGVCTIMVKNSKYADFTTVKTMQVSSNASVKQDVSEWLANGGNNIKITIAGVNTDKITAPITYTVQLTSLGISAPNFRWWTAFTDAINIPLNIGGNISKTLYVTITGDGYTKNYDIPLGTTVYTETAYNYQLQHPGKSGVYNVSMYVTNTDGTIRTRTVSYNIICVKAGDSVKLIAVNNIIEKATNWTENALFDYTIFDGNNAVTSARFVAQKAGAPVFSSEEDTISTSAKHTFSLPLEIDTIDNADFDLVVKVQDEDEKLALAMTIPVNNSLGFSSIAGAAFYMNPRTRSNSQSNYLSVVNEMTGELVPATWKGMNWGSDGWATDTEGGRVLRVMASSQVGIGYKVFAKEAARVGKTIEIDYKVDNVTDFNYPVIRLSSDNDAFVGLRVFPDNVVMYSNALKNTDNQGINLFEGKRLRLTLVIMPDAYGRSGFNLCIIYINGVKNREFTYENNDYFSQQSDILIGSDYADVDVYGMRVYDSALTSESVLRNYINWLVNNADKSRVKAVNDVMDGNGSEVDFENTKDQFNVFVFDNSFPSLSNPNKMTGTLEVLYAAHPEWNVSISNVEAKGQGTSSMRYWKWNVRFSLDKKLSTVTSSDGSISTGGWAMVPALAKATKITAKKNFASSMHSHKVGSVNSVDDLYRAMGYLNEAMKTDKYANARVAVYQLPFVAFEKSINEEGETVYTFMGLYTMGPDKGDKNTFGHDTDLFPGLLAIEGSDNSPLCALFRVPWNSRMQYNEEEEAFQYNGANSWDFGAGDIANISKWLPAYNLAYSCSNRLKPFNGTSVELNAQVSTYRNEPYEFWISKAGDPELYNVYYYETSAGKFIASDIGAGTINLRTQLADKGYGLSSADLSGKTAAQLNELFISARIEKFRKESPLYWDIDDAILHRNWVEFHAGTDNRAKNTYPYCFGTAGSKWKWRYDDLDTIFDTDNQGQAKKGYYVEFHDRYDTGGSVWNGETSNFWNLLDLAFPDEIWAGMRKMMQKMAELGDLKSGTDFDKLYAYFHKYYFTQAQEYFPQNLYNADAKFTYENSKLAYMDGKYTNDTDPITQSLGDHYSAEQRWITKRILYMMSKYSFGLFSADGTDNITVRAAGNTIKYELTPAMDMYPAIANGTSIIRGGRTKAGEVCEMLIELSGSGDQQNTIQAASYLQDIGDWHDKNVTGSMIIQGRMLRDIRLGSKTQPITISVASLTLSNCVSLQNLDLSRISTLRGTLNLSACTHLKKVHAGGTSLTQLVLPKGGGLEEIEYSANNQYVMLQNYPLIKNDGVLLDYCKENVTDFFVDNCSQLKPMQLLSTIIEAQQSQGGNHALKHIRAVGFEEEYYSPEALDMLAKLSDKSYSGLSAEGLAGDEQIPVLEGTITVHSKYYQDSVEELRNRFKRLSLVMDGIPAIRFADKEVLKVLTTESAYIDYPNVSTGSLSRIDRDDDGMIDHSEAANIQSLSKRPDRNNSVFANNTKIETFNEFQYFTGLEIVNNGCFEGCTSLREVTLPSIKISGNHVFKNSGIRKIVIPEGYVAIGNGFCENAYNCRLIDFPNSVTTIGELLIRTVNNVTTIVCRAIIPPTFGGFGYGGVPVAIYVPDTSVAAYKIATNWNTFSSKIHPLSEYVES